MLQFLHSIPHDLLVVGLTLLAVVWCFGARWCWRFLGDGMLKHPALRVPIALALWPVYLLLILIVSRFGVVQAILAACLLGAMVAPRPVLADSSAQDGDTIPVHARAICQGGKLVGIEVFTPVPGVVTIPIPPDVCQRQPQGDVQPAPKMPPLRAT